MGKRVRERDEVVVVEVVGEAVGRTVGRRLT